MYNFETEERFSDKRDLPTLSRTIEAMRVQASTIGVVIIAIPKLCCRLDQRNWQEVLKLLRDIFAQTDVQFVEFTLEQTGVHAMSSEGDADSHTPMMNWNLTVNNSSSKTVS